jgi:hypothetical protein
MRKGAESYVAKRVEEGNFEILLQETPRADPPKKLIRRQAHANELAKEKVLLETLPAPDYRNAVVLDPSNGMLAVVRVPQADPEFPEVRDAKAAANLTATEFAKRIESNQQLSRNILKRLIEGEITDYEEFSSSIPNAEFDDVVKQISRAYKKKSFKLQTSNQQFEIGGFQGGAPLHLESNQVFTVRGCFQKQTGSGSGATWITLKIDSKFTEDKDFVEEFGIRPELDVLLSTREKGKTMKAIKFAFCFDVEIEVEIRRTWNLKRAKWEFHLKKLSNEGKFFELYERAKAISFA